MILPDYSTFYWTVNRDIAINRENDNDIVLNIDLLQSIVYHDGSQTYGFNPELKYMDYSQTGTFRGRTFPQAEISLYDSDTDELVRFTISDGANLEFGFYGLEQDRYDFICMPIGNDTLQYDSLFNANFSVLAGHDHDVGLLTLPEK